MEKQPPMTRMINMKGKRGSEAKRSNNQSERLELTNPTSIRLVHACPPQIALLEEDARTNVRRHGTAEVGIVRDRQGL
jgi:hypothetical protein